MENVSLSSSSVVGEIRRRLLGIKDGQPSKTGVWANIIALTPDHVNKPKVELGNTTPAKFVYVVKDLSAEDAISVLAQKMATTLHDVLGDFKPDNSLVIRQLSLEHKKSVKRYELSAWIKYE